jgi:ATP-dependent Clp protease, protease subunit
LKTNTDEFEKWQEYGIDLTDRRILLDDGLETAVINCCIANLLWMDKTAGPIDLWVNSPGGDITGMWAIYDIIQNANNRVNTIGIGEISSAAVLLLTCGTGIRYAMPNALLMHHATQHEVTGHHKAVVDYMGSAIKEEERWLRTLAKHTNVKYVEWKRRAQGEWYMTATEMLELGVVDKIYGADKFYDGGGSIF